VSVLALKISNDGKHRGQVLINRETVGSFARVTPAIISLTKHFMPEHNDTTGGHSNKCIVFAS